MIVRFFPFFVKTCEAWIKITANILKLPGNDLPKLVFGGSWIYKSGVCKQIIMLIMLSIFIKSVQNMPAKYQNLPGNERHFIPTYK